MKVTLYNSFHDQEITIIPKDIKNFHDETTEIYISKNQIRRIRRKLCGIKACCCKTYSSAKSNGQSIKNWDGHLWIAEEK